MGSTLKEPNFLILGKLPTFRNLLNLFFYI